MTAEVIEGEAREVESRSLVTVPDQGMTASGAMALAALPDDEFDRRLAALEKGRDRVARIQRALMVKDVDFGTIPGTPKPTLLKPGAEKLCQAYGLVADFTPTRLDGDGESGPALRWAVRCELHLGSLDGPIVAVGNGASNSWERKHRYRNAELSCPECGNGTGTLKKSKREPGWYCWAKIGGCGATFGPDDPRVRDQVVGQVENPDPYDLDVTLLKMAEKRAYIDATLRATAASGLFTQDIEDTAQPAATPPDEKPADRSDDGGLIGTADISKGNPEFALRATPDGHALEFRLVSGRKQIKAVAFTPIAERLVALRDQVLGQRVTAWGSVEDESYDKFDEKKGRTVTVTYPVLSIDRITGPTFSLPEPEAEPEPTEAPSIGMFSDEERDAINAAVDAA